VSDTSSDQGKLRWGSLAGLLTYVRADTAQKAQSASEDETAPPFEVLPQPLLPVAFRCSMGIDPARG
jgi:hypothetical protein